MNSIFKTALLASAMLATSTTWAAGFSSWVTPMKCGDATARYTATCAKGKEEGRDDCKQPQMLEFLDKTGAVIKTIKLPVFQPKEIATFKTAGTADEMFGRNWACIQSEGKSYFMIYYASYSGGEAEGNEKYEFYSAAGEGVVAKAAQDKLYAADEANTDKKKAHKLKSIFQ